MTYEPPQYPPIQPMQPPHGYGYPPQSPVAPAWMPPAAGPAKTWTGKRVVLAVVGGVLVLCCGGIGLAALTGDPETTTTSSAPAGTSEQKAAGEAQPAQDSEKAPVEQPPDTFNVPAGSKITHQDGGDTIEAVMRSARTHKQGCNSLDVDPENGLFVVVDVVVKQTKGKGSVNPLDFTFVADDGTSANALSAAFSGCDEPSLASADLRAGQKRAGKIAFDIGMKKGTLEWAPGGLGADTVGSWAVK